ncbi:MAG: PGF-CTERM sorting domain-containing protein [Candidatus Heimdallarchaeota archaeon]
MKKSKILALVMLTAVFASAFSVATITTSPAHFAVGSAPSVIDEPTVFHPDKMSYDNGTWAQFTTTAFTPDGNLTEWDTEGIISEVFGGVTVYLAYDATYVYVGATWADSTYSADVSEWNKTDAADGFTMLAGDDDVITVGFDDGSDADYWTWTASNRTADAYAYEHDGAGVPDAGVLPFVMNTNDTDFSAGTAPFWDNSWTPIVDYTTIPINTQITGWYLDETTPTGSQADVDVGWNHTGSAYVVEFVRLLDTSVGDDFVFDFTNNDVNFYIGVANGDDAMDMDIAVSEHLIFDDNTAAELTFDAVPADVTSSLLLQGTAFDDYEDYYVTVWVETWEDTWGSVDYVTVNRITGAWSYLLIFNEMDMPLGDNNVWITLYAPYEAPLALNYSTYWDDVTAPSIIGINNLTERYETGCPGDEGYVTVTVGLNDDYDNVNYLTANLYSYVDEGIALATPMTQFYPDSSTFNANITIDPTADYSYSHNITYFVQAWDTSNNKVRSADYTFFTAITVVTPGFGIIAGIFGLAVAVLFVKKLKK